MLAGTLPLGLQIKLHGSSSGWSCASTRLPIFYFVRPLLHGSSASMPFSHGQSCGQTQKAFKHVSETSPAREMLQQLPRQHNLSDDCR